MALVNVDALGGIAFFEFTNMNLLRTTHLTDLENPVRSCTRTRRLY